MEITNKTEDGQNAMLQMLQRGGALDENNNPSEKFNELIQIVFTSVADIQSKVRELLTNPDQKQEKIGDFELQGKPLTVEAFVELVHLALSNGNTGVEIRDLLGRDYAEKKSDSNIVSFRKKKQN